MQPPHTNPHQHAVHGSPRPLRPDAVQHLRPTDADDRSARPIDSPPDPRKGGLAHHRHHQHRIRVQRDRSSLAGDPARPPGIPRGGRAFCRRDGRSASWSASGRGGPAAQRFLRRMPEHGGGGGNGSPSRDAVAIAFTNSVWRANSAGQVACCAARRCGSKMFQLNATASSPPAARTRGCRGE